MNNVSDVPFTYTHVADTHMNDRPNFIFNGTTNHSSEEEWGDVIVEGSPDNVEGNINNEWVDMIEETNAVLKGMMTMLLQEELYP